MTEAMPARFAEAREAVERVFGHKAAGVEAKEAKQLRRTLEKILGPREEWRLPLLRELWSARCTPAHETAGARRTMSGFFQLAGYCLRPGFGYPLDEWRCGQTFRLFGEGVTFHDEPQVWSEFWIQWRRIAGGLSEAPQKELWNYLKPYLARRVPPTLPTGAVKTKGVQPEGLDEMVRTAASLEHLEPLEKIELGNWITERVKHSAASAGPWTWALGRLGGRVPAYGSGHKTVPVDQAAAWMSSLLGAGLDRLDGSVFAVVQLCRLTGDRSRDLDDDTRAQAVAALKTAGTPDEWLRTVTEVVQLAASDEARVLGDTLPVGLRLR